jgi:ketosteroid isomerase-like protein
MSIKPQVMSLIALVQRGKITEALDTFYADDVAMQENLAAPTVGLAANREREIAFFGSLRTFSFTLASVVVEGEHAAINWLFDYTTADGTRYRMDQIAVQTWRNGKVVRERFIYDTATLAAAA